MRTESLGAMADPPRPCFMVHVILSWFPVSADGWLQAVFHTCEAVALIHQPYIGDISTIGL